MSANSGRLAGKVAIITGASAGSGPVVAKLFVEQGAKVLFLARREELGLDGNPAGPALLARLNAVPQPA